MARHNRPSHVLQALGLDQELIAGALRVSIGPSTTQSELQAFVPAYVQAVRALLG